MMTDYQIQPNSRRCVVSGRELQPGEKFFAVLVEEGDRFLRQDYAAEVWQGPPAGAFSFWTGRVPPKEASDRPHFDDEMLLDCFQRLENDTEPRKVSFRYVVALLLMRRRRLKFEESIKDGDQEKLSLRCTRTGTAYQVIDPKLSDEELEKVQEDVFQVLGWN
jgi:hypothetical protein